MVHKYIEAKTEPKGMSPPEFAWRLERTRKAFRAKKFDYLPEDYITRRQDVIEETNQSLQTDYGSTCVRKKFLRIMRIALPEANMFQFDDATLDKAHKVKSALCYWITCDILNEEALSKDNIEVIMDHAAAQHVYQIGRIISPSIEPIYRDGKLKEYRIAAFNHLYFIEDTTAAINALIKKWGRPVKLYCVAIGRLQGPMYENDCTYTIFNEDDFIASDVKAKDRGQNILDLVNANKKGFLGPGDKNGVDRYLTTMKKLSDKGLTASEIDQLDVETLRDVLANRKRKLVAAVK